MVNKPRNGHPKKVDGRWIVRKFNKDPKQNIALDCMKIRTSLKKLKDVEKIQFLWKICPEEARYFQEKKSGYTKVC